MSALDEVSDQPVSLEDLLEARRGPAQNLPKSPTFENLSEKKRAAVELLAMGTSYTATAKAVGVDRRTIFEWRQDELFQSEVRRRHQQLWGDPTERLHMLADPAIEVLAEHLNETWQPSRFRAATTILRLVKLSRREQEKSGS